MNTIAIMLGILMAVSVYLLLSTQLNRWLYGLILFSSVINMVILLLGRVYFSLPAFIGQGTQEAEQHLGNPLPQAMVLTAIVIAFALVAFSLIVLRALYHQNHSLQDEPQSLADTQKRRTRG